MYTKNNYTDSSTIGKTQVSFHFVTNEGDDDDGGSCTVTAPIFRARKRLAIGVNTDYSDYQLYVNGTGYFSSILHCNGIAANIANSGTAGGIALYGTLPGSFGIAMRETSNGGKHGYVQGDWAIYSYMHGAGAETDSTNSFQRGWIWRNAQYNNTVASINGRGNAVFNGSVTIGGNATNTSGCRVQYNSTLDTVNFVFV